MFKNIIKSYFFLILILLGIFAIFSINFLNTAQSSIDCCYNECQPTDPARCDGVWTQKCDKCDSDPYYDWCDQTNCADSGQICLNGACVAGTGCTIICATGPGCRYSLANGAAVAGECCSTGDCYDCKTGWSWSGSTCVSVCADNDNDGYGNPAAITCAKPQLDCDDSNININPGATEICDGADNNCDGQTDEGCDNDNDDYCACGQTFAYGSDLTATCLGTNTTDAAAIANTCDCKDNNAAINLAAAEICNNILDDDCDANIDCADADCASNAACTGATTCSDGTETNTCSTASGAPWYCDNTKNLIENCTTCGCSGSWVCSIAGSYCCDNTCNGSCSPAGCTVANDPDCACLNNNGCCGIGCNNANDNDCLVSCTENWTCTAWSACAGAKQTKTCIDSNNCGTTVNKPAEEQLCVVVKINSPKDGNNYFKGDKLSFCAQSYGGASPYAYQWNSNLAGNFLSSECDQFDTSGWSVGTHTITVTATDSSGKTGSNSILININPPGTLIANISMWQTEFAKIANFAVSIAGGVSPYSFEWKSDKQGVFSTTQWPSIDVSGWAEGDHLVTVTVTDSNGATAVDTINIKIVDLAVSFFPMDGMVAQQGFNVWFGTNISGGTTPYSCVWKLDTGAVIGNSCSFSKDDFALGVYAITATVTDADNLSKSATTHIQIIPVTPITVNITSPSDNSIFQQGNDITFSATFSGGVNPSIFNWSSNKDGVISTALNFNKNNLSVNSHIITFTASDSKGNSGSSSINLNITPPTALAAIINSPSNGSSFLRLDNYINFIGSASGGVTPYTYSWSSDKDGNLGSGDKIVKNNLSVNSHIITLTITDNVGAVVTANVNITINAGCSSSNIKNIAKYNSEEVFLISNNNWRDVLSLVPLTTWNDSGTIKKYPALIFHNEPASFDADSTIHFLQMYAPNHLTTIGSIPAGLNNLFIAASPSGAGMNAGNIANINTSDYFSYWSSFNSLVAVDYNDYKAGLMASVFASHKNSPIIFVNSANLAAYQSIINGKIIYTVGSLDAATQAYINSNAGCQVNYALDELQKWYAAETNSDKLILVNSNDLTIEVISNFTPQKSAQISKLFGRMSLAAPFLAAARQEVIAYTLLADPGANSSCSAAANVTANVAQADTDSANAITDLFLNKPNYLTVVAAPRAIPDSQYSGSCYGGYQYRNPKDFKYGSLDDSSIVPEELKAGRIYGVTVSDASAHIAQSLNFDYLNNKIYGGNYFGLTIAKTTDWTYHNTLAAEIRNKSVDSGYNSICYTQNNQPNCNVAQVPPLSDYSHKNFIIYFDHGTVNSWWGGIII